MQASFEGNILIVSAEPGLSEEQFKVIPYVKHVAVDYDFEFYTQEANDLFPFSGLNIFDKIASINGNTITFSNSYVFFKDSLGIYVNTGNNLNRVIAATNNSLTFKDDLQTITKCVLLGFIANLYYFKFSKTVDYAEVILGDTIVNTLFNKTSQDIDLTLIENTIESLSVDIKAVEYKVDTSIASLNTLDTKVNTLDDKIDSLGASLNSVDYLTAQDIIPLFDNSYDTKVFQ